jgi:hypothetical protein
VLLLGFALSAAVALAEVPTALASGRLVSWGGDRAGLVSRTPAGNDFAAVAAGSEQSVAIRSDGRLVSWGEDRSGLVSDTPTGGGFRAVAAGAGHSVALRGDGSLVTWGYRFVNWDCDSDGNCWKRGNRAPPGNDFTAVAAAADHLLALKRDGSLVSWTDSPSKLMSDMPSGGDFTAIATGGYVGVALDSDGSLVPWGDTHWFSLVSDIPSGGGFTAVAAGWTHAVALRSDGSLVSWGWDDGGVVAGTPEGTDFTAVAAGVGYSVALRRDGSLVAWGANYAGQVSHAPTGTGYTAVAAGAHHGVALREATAPAIDLKAPADGTHYTLGSALRADYSCADERGGSGLKTCNGDAANLASLDDSSVGEKTFTVRAQDNADNIATKTAHYGVVYDFAGFASPVRNTDGNGSYVLNKAKPGAAIPVKFSLHGDHGLAVLQPGYPRSKAIACDPSAEVDGNEQTATARGSALSYDATADQYIYVWKTDRTWRGCRQLIVKLDDGTSHRASFRFAR